MARKGIWAGNRDVAQSLRDYIPRACKVMGAANIKQKSTDGDEQQPKTKKRSFDSLLVPIIKLTKKQKKKLSNNRGRTKMYHPDCESGVPSGDQKSAKKKRDNRGNSIVPTKKVAAVKESPQTDDNRRRTPIYHPDYGSGVPGADQKSTKKKRGNRGKIIPTKKVAAVKKSRPQKTKNMTVQLHKTSIPRLEKTPWAASMDGPLTHLESVSRLDSELELFSRYVRLTELEAQARRDTVNVVTETARALFQKRTPPNNGNGNKNIEDIFCKVFGSFATPSVCSFQSDVDMALWGVVPCEELPPAVARSAPQKICMHTNLKTSKRSRHEEWRQAFLMHDMDQANQECASDGFAVDSTNKLIPAATSLEIEPATTAADDFDSMFVIDRIGNNSDGDKPKAIDNTEKEIGNAKNVEAESVSDGSESEWSVDMTTSQQMDRSNLRMDVMDELSRPSYDDSSDGDSEGEIMEKPAAGMHVGYFIGSNSGSIARKMHAPSQVPIGRVKNDVVAALGTLSNRLRKSKVNTNVFLIKHARVPIIKVDTCLGFQTDICVGGHNGADTSLYAGACAAKYSSFAAVVLFLKVLLSQHSLDVPFNGGLGSYKLYVLVADHIAKYLANGGKDVPGNVLVSFFYRYGREKQPRMTNVTSEKLEQHVPLYTKEGVYADLSNVKRLDDCVSLFTLCYRRLNSQTILKLGKKNRSLLSQLVCPLQLQNERDKVARALVSSSHQLERVKAAQRARGSYDTIATLASPPGAAKRTKRMPINPIQRSSPQNNRDLSATELIAGYTGDRQRT